MPSESDVQAAIKEALIYDGFLVFRPNQGARQENKICELCYGNGCASCNEKGRTSVRYIPFVTWQHLGIDQQDSGIADVIAVKYSGRTLIDGIQRKKHSMLLAVECKSPGKAERLRKVLDNPLKEGCNEFSRLPKREQNQARFLWAVQEHGGISIIADDLSDVLPYLDRVEAG